MREFYANHKKGIIITICIIVGILIFRTVNISIQQSMRTEPVVDIEDDKTEEEFTGTNTYLWGKQRQLTKRYGKCDEGFIWDSTGDKLAMGDKKMSGEDVVYIYLQSLSKLDLSNAQRYSRKTSVVKKYLGMYDDKVKTDYSQQFQRNMYAEALKSLQIKKVESTASLDSSKAVYTVTSSIIDLTNKDFWKNDRTKIYKDLTKYKVDQGDYTKGDTYLYDYILGYFKKNTAIRRNITFDITVEKFSDLGTGWLVSEDEDLNNACLYKDGKTIISYIKEEYSDYRRENR